MRWSGSAMQHSGRIVRNIKQEFLASYKSSPSRNILSADESCWLALWQLKKGFAETASESLNMHLNGDPKARMTLVGAIAADGSKWPCSWSPGERPRCAINSLFPTFLTAPDTRKAVGSMHKFSSISSTLSVLSGVMARSRWALTRTPPTDRSWPRLRDTKGRLN